MSNVRKDIIIAKKIFSAAIFLKIGLAQILWVPRAYSLEDIIYYSVNGGGGGGFNILPQILTIVSFVSGVYVIFSMKNIYFQPDENKYILCAWLAYCCAQILSDVINGAGFSINRFIPLIAPLVYYVSTKEEYYILYNSTYAILGAIIIGGLVAAVFMPDWAFIYDYGLQSETAIFDTRFSGLLSHPNQVGSLAAIVCIMYFFSNRNGASKVILLGAILTIVMAQSKTAFSCMCISLIYLVAVTNARFNLASKYILFIGSFIFIFGWIIYMDLYIYLPESDLTSLTGRVAIWDEAINIWRSSPIVGAGSSVWDLDRREDTGLTGAANAHNNFLTTISMYGILGGVTLLWVICSIIKKTSSGNNRKNAAINAVMIYVMYRGFSEPSFGGYGVDLVAIIVLFMNIGLKDGNESI